MGLRPPDHEMRTQSAGPLEAPFLKTAREFVRELLRESRCTAARHKTEGLGVHADGQHRLLRCALRDLHHDVGLPFATDHYLSALAAIRSTERGVMQVRSNAGRRGSPHLTSPCDRAHYGYFVAQPVWRYAASLAGRPDMPVGPL